MNKKAVVKEIQVCGYKSVDSLEEACEKYSQVANNYESYRPKIIFVIELPNGETKQITIRDEDDQTVVYGDFEGLPDFLEYSKIVHGVEEDLVDNINIDSKIDPRICGIVCEYDGEEAEDQVQRCDKTQCRCGNYAAILNLMSSKKELLVKALNRIFCDRTLDYYEIYGIASKTLEDCGCNAVLEGKMNIISDKMVKTRKVHKCWGCTEDIPIGTTVMRVTSVDGGEIATVYWCDRCADFLTKVDCDEDGWGFGELKQCEGYSNGDV